MPSSIRDVARPATASAVSVSQPKICGTHDGVEAGALGALQLAGEVVERPVLGEGDDPRAHAFPYSWTSSMSVPKDPFGWTKATVVPREPGRGAASMALPPAATTASSATPQSATR